MAWGHGGCAGDGGGGEATRQKIRRSPSHWWRPGVVGVCGATPTVGGVPRHQVVVEVPRPLLDDD